MFDINAALQGLDHIVLRVVDLDRSIGFYTDVLGCSVEREVQGLGLVQLRAGDSLLDLVDVSGQLGARGGAAAGSTGRNLDHFCLRLDPFDADALRAFLQAKGITAGATETRYGARGFGPSIYIQDPDGNTVELKGPAQAAADPEG